MASAAEQPPSQPGPEYLASTRFLDCESEAVRGFADRVIAGERAPISRAIKLFYAVRDQWRYDPLSMRLTPDAYITSHVLLQVAATSCIPKAILLAAAARAVGIPAGMGLADVVNQLTTPKLRERVGGATTSCTTATRPSFIPLLLYCHADRSLRDHLAMMAAAMSFTNSPQPVCVKRLRSPVARTRVRGVRVLLA